MLPKSACHRQNVLVDRDRTLEAPSKHFHHALQRVGRNNPTLPSARWFTIIAGKFSAGPRWRSSRVGQTLCRRGVLTGENRVK
jgi:hypothetical protein